MSRTFAPGFGGLDIRRGIEIETEIFGVPIQIDIPTGGGGPLPPAPPDGGGGCPAGWSEVPFPFQNAGECAPNQTFLDAPSGSGPCVLPWRPDPISGVCKLFVGDVAGPDPGRNGGSGVHAGRVHGDRAPTRVTRSVRQCPRGMVLGNQGFCHEHIANKDRMWPKARRPLLTGGDLNAITKASQAAKRLKTQEKRLQKLGMLPKKKSPITVAQAKKILHHAQV